MDLNDSQFKEIVHDSQSVPLCHGQPHSQTPAHNPSNTQEDQGQAPSGTKRKSRGSSTQRGRFYWDNRSSVTLIEAKRACDEVRFHAGVAGRAKTVEEQWLEIVSVMASKGVFVDWKIANDKWKRMSALHKEISDWERNTPSGKNSYWQMSQKERKEEGKFSHLDFDRDIYDVMEQHFGRDPVIHPTAPVVDTTNISENRQTSGSFSSPMASSAADSEVGQGCPQFEQTPSSFGQLKKVRKITHVYDFGLKDATRDIVSVLEAAEDAKAMRHQEVIECNKQMVEIERSKVEMGLRFAAGIESLSNALKSIADKL